MKRKALITFAACFLIFNFLDAISSQTTNSVVKDEIGPRNRTEMVLRGTVQPGSLLPVIRMTRFSEITYPDIFEFLTYSPPNGWTKKTIEDGIAYQRQNGIGLVAIYDSYPTTGSAQHEFAAVWKQRLAATIPGPQPKPQFERDGDVTAAVGSTQVNAEGTITTISLVVFTGHGRAIGVLAMSAGEDVFREVTAFFDSIKITPGTALRGNREAVKAGGIEVDFDVPRGYTSQRDGSSVVLKPVAISKSTPCVYVIGPSRPSRGDLETDAKSVVLDVLPAWQLKDEHYHAVRGIGDGGWPYFAINTNVQMLIDGTYQYLSVVSMAFPAGPGRVNNVWGFGSSDCTGEEISFARLFHSLRPRTWTADGGKALARELNGTWQNSQQMGLERYTFTPGGRYEYGMATIARVGIYDSRHHSVTDGRYHLNGSELSLTPDGGRQGVKKYRVRIFEKKHTTGAEWWRMMFLINESVDPPTDVRYYRIEK